MPDPGHPDFRLRALRGPLEGATYLLRDSFLLGRSGVCDLALLDRRVSRLHARVGRPASALTTPRGGHVLYDLASSNGTRVNGEPIGARALAPRDEIEIGDNLFRYEPIPELSQPTAEDDTSASTRRPAEPRVTPSTAPYRGDLLADVMTYRRLVNQRARGEALEVRMLERFHALDARLRDASTSDFLQFSYGCGARLRSGSTGAIAHRDVDVVSLGVGGATLRNVHPFPAIDEVVHLIFERPWSTRDRVALVGVVARADDSSCRIAFSFGAGFAPRTPEPTEVAPRLRGFRTRAMACLET